MEEGVPSATGSEPVKEKCVIWCGKRNKTQKKTGRGSNKIFFK